MSETGATFDPKPYLTKVSGRDYLPVAPRLLWLRTIEPDAIIETELVQHQNNVAVFKARVTLPSGASATGWARETAEGFGDYLEKAETAALGRALAALGYGTQFSGDYEGGGEYQEPRRAAPPSPAGGSGYAPRPSNGGGRGHIPFTDRQEKFLLDQARNKGISEAQLHGAALAMFNADSWAILDKQQMSKLIDAVVNDQIERIAPAGQTALPVGRADVTERHGAAVDVTTGEIVSDQPLTADQQRTLVGMCKARGLDPDSAATDRYGQPLEDISFEQATSWLKAWYAEQRRAAPPEPSGDFADLDDVPF